MAIDVDTKECLAIWASEGRSSFHAYVLKKSLRIVKTSQMWL